ncbi:MAG: YqgE/AlgH family protein [Sporichthyaceae bacterium]
MAFPLLPNHVSAGQLLVASPDLDDPNFARTVVLLLSHAPDGSLGVVLNRPTEMTVASVLSGWGGIGSDPDVVYAGGPVGVDSALALAALDAVPAGTGAARMGWRPVVGSVGLINLDTDPASLSGSLQGMRVFAGYAGWSGGQLMGELGEGSWAIVDSHAGDAFTRHPGKLWSTVLRRQGGELALLASRPADPRMN